MKIILNIVIKYTKKLISYLLILLMLGVALSLPLSLYLSVQSTNYIFKNVSINPKITIYLNTSANKVDIETINKKLKKLEYIKSIDFIDKKSALKKMAQNLGSENILPALSSNPLPDAFIITPSTQNPTNIKLLLSNLNNLQMVDDVQIDANWVQTLYNINLFLWKVLSFLSITLCVTFLLITYNTIRLQILIKKDEIEVSRLLGANTSYILQPFLLQSFIQSIITYIIAISFSSITIHKTTKLALNIFSNYGIFIETRWFSIKELVLIFIIISLISLTGSWLAVKNHLLEVKQKYQ